MRDDLRAGIYGAVGAFIAVLSILYAVDRYLRRPLTRYQLKGV